jgi:hypothetical protein
MAKCPCKGCLPPKRSASCHSTCSAYAEWVEERAREKQAAWEQKQMDKACDYFSSHLTCGDYAMRRSKR